MLNLGKLGEAIFRMLDSGELGEVSFRMFDLSDISESESIFKMLKLGKSCSVE